MNKRTRYISLGTLGALGAISFGGFGAAPAQAGETGRRNTTLGLGAITAYGLLKGKKKIAIAGGVGTAIAYTQYNKAKRNRQRREEARRQAWYRQRYGRMWRNYYKPGA